jgi:acyl-coenzyme A thioesterase PaaI-like protein
MHNKKPIDLYKFFQDVLGDKINDFTLPPPSFTVMQCEVIAYDEKHKSLIAKLPVLKQWSNPYGTMQGGMIDAAIDNAVGPLSMLVAPPNMTRSIETKLIKAITIEIEYIYVKVQLVEEKKRRLTFEVSVEDVEGVVYATSKVVNFMV